MRLGQLSRKLGVNSSAIVEVLKENFREVNDHPNVKILDEELDYLTNHFSPSAPAESEQELIDDTASTAPEVKVEEPELADTEQATETPQEEAPAFVESLRPKVIRLEDEFNQMKSDLESFKAEKPELEGLKVLGKIDLPEPKPKAPKETPSEDEPKGTQTINERGVRKRHQKRGNQRKPKGNTAEAERKRAEYQAKKRKAQEQEKLKELKKKHYEEQVKAKLKEKPKKKKKKKFIEQQVNSSPSQNGSKQRAKSGNALVRFWRWLNGDYDKFD